MEDWQQWQIRADEVASGLGRDVDALEAELDSPNFRAFWQRFRDLKERVRTAPAIRLEDKLQLERRLRGVGSRAYKAQEALFAKSADRKQELLESIASLRNAADSENTPRRLRELRRDLDGIRERFDEGEALSPADRQAIWDSWRETNQFVWQRLTDKWSENEEILRGILSTARAQIDAGQASAGRQSVGRFFESLRTRETKQAVINSLKTEAEELRSLSDRVEERRTAERAASQPPSAASPIDSWRSDVERNREAIARLAADVADVEQQMQDADSLLEQAMLRGTVVDKRRKLTELERANRSLEQRIEQSEESPLIPSA